ncbi:MULTISPECIES: hypothetical protein [Pantoea]|nr:MULTISPECIES: hypothetical protein [Pantoea]
MTLLTEILPGFISNETGSLLVITLLVVLGMLIQLAFTLSVFLQGLDDQP